MEIEFFLTDLIFFCLSVYASAVLVVLFWLLFTLVLYVPSIIYHADVPVHTLLHADTNTSQDRDTAAGN